MSPSIEPASLAGGLTVTAAKITEVAERCAGSETRPGAADLRQIRTCAAALLLAARAVDGQWEDAATAELLGTIPPTAHLARAEAHARGLVGALDDTIARLADLDHMSLALTKIKGLRNVAQAELSRLEGVCRLLARQALSWAGDPQLADRAPELAALIGGAMTPIVSPLAELADRVPALAPHRAELAALDGVLAEGPVYRQGCLAGDRAVRVPVVGHPARVAALVERFLSLDLSSAIASVTLVLEANDP